METQKKTYLCTAKTVKGAKCCNKLSSEFKLDYDERKCHLHIDTESFNWEIGTCYECHGPCNPCSQLCGGCARRLTMSALGWY
ncbi:hypothetical protein CPAV1605_599 [seawater metagenome]|uniref:Uncharacterized protein n=1 Tax=seawater metagenome TaxID=1561972 RepID=A0A5E8CJQ9_9ZZZZ